MQNDFTPILSGILTALQASNQPLLNDVLASLKASVPIVLKLNSSAS